MKYPWMPLFWGDFLANTMHLSAQEAGAYLFLIAHAWEHDGEIPADRIRLARIAHVRPDQWKKVWNALQQFFETASDVTSSQCYTHRRVMDELRRLGKISSKRKATAEQMHRSYGRFTVNQTPLTTSRTIIESSVSVAEARSLATALPTGALAPSPLPNLRDKGVDYRSPSPKRSNNDLTDPNRDDLKALEAKRL